MKIIKEISEMIEDELEGAEHYIECALKHKADHPALADVFYEISTQEMRHVNMLHDEVVKLIKEYRGKNGNPPEAMQAIWEWQHERHIESLKEIKILQDHYHNAR